MKLLLNLIIKINPIPLGEVEIGKYFSFNSKGYDASQGVTDIWIKTTATKAINITTLEIIKISWIEVDRAVYPVKIPQEIPAK